MGKCAIWIARDENGIVQAASVAEYTQPDTLKEWRKNGQTPEMVHAESVTLGRPLPYGVVPLQ